ncbi:Zn-ribbon domain-containing OB-fold protein [Streptomyces venezuelae ATCC 10712]
MGGGRGERRRDGLLVRRDAPPVLPGLRPPYAVGLIELAEGVRMVSNVVGVPYDKVRIGMPVRLEFLRVDEELELPVFRAGGED